MSPGLAADRMLAFSKANAKATSELMVIRDKGIAASGCYYGVLIDDVVVAARIDASERAAFKVEPGARPLKVTRDPQGKGLCGAGSDQTEVTIQLESGEIKKYRLTLDLSGQPASIHSLNKFIC